MENKTTPSLKTEAAHKILLAGGRIGEYHVYDADGNIVGAVHGHTRNAVDNRMSKDAGLYYLPKGDFDTDEFTYLRQCARSNYRTTFTAEATRRARK